MEFPTWPQMELQKNTFQFQAIVQSYNYTIIGSKALRPNTDYTLSLTIHDEKCEINEPIVVCASIIDDTFGGEFNVHRDVTINPNDTAYVAIPVGDLSPDRNYKLITKAILGANMVKQVLIFNPKNTRSSFKRIRPFTNQTIALNFAFLFWIQN